MTCVPHSANYDILRKEKQKVSGSGRILREERHLEKTKSGKLGLGEKKGLEMSMSLREEEEEEGKGQKKLRDKEEERNAIHVLPWARENSACRRIWR
uniref:Uncharacterized protein n=1 Tax=Cucumis melo TaxID=3656 RepID=A0A9I9D8X6_CUCME